MASSASNSCNTPSTRENSQGSLTLTKHDSIKSKNSTGLNRRSLEADMTFGGNANGQMTCSTDTLNSLAGDATAVTLRKKGNRLSFPAALNNASDKLFGKRKSGDSFKSKSSSSERPEKKEKKRLKHLFSMKRTSSKKDLSQSIESGLNEIGSISDLLEQSDSNHNETCNSDDFVGEVVFKPRYTPQDEKQLDSWQTGAADAPLADSEGDSPLFLEPPVRSFPLSLTPLPQHCHSDLYDTAFALASLRAGNESSSGLNYLNKVHAVVKEACKVTNNNNNHVTKMVDITNKQEVDNTQQSLSLTEGNKYGRS